MLIDIAECQWCGEQVWSKDGHMIRHAFRPRKWNAEYRCFLKSYIAVYCPGSFQESKKIIAKGNVSQSGMLKLNAS